MSKTKIREPMVFEKSTKGTHRYAAVRAREEAAISTLYIQKEALGEDAPQHIVVSIEEDTTASGD